METPLDQDLSDALPPIRIIQLPPLRPVFLLEDWEIGKRQLLPTVAQLPIAVFIDDQLRVHFEINHALNVIPPMGWKDFFFPMQRYRSIAPKLIESSFLKKERRLIGGLYGVYLSAQKYVVVFTAGILPLQELPDIPKENRLKAFDVIMERLHEFNRWLGADFVHSGPTVIPDKVWQRIGCERYRVKKWQNRWRLYRDSFPVCLRKRVRVYIKKYRDIEIDY